MKIIVRNVEVIEVERVLQNIEELASIQNFFFFFFYQEFDKILNSFRQMENKRYLRYEPAKNIDDRQFFREISLSHHPRSCLSL